MQLFECLILFHPNNTWQFEFNRLTVVSSLQLPHIDDKSSVVVADSIVRVVFVYVLWKPSGQAWIYLVQEHVLAMLVTHQFLNADTGVVVTSEFVVVNFCNSESGRVAAILLINKLSESHYRV